MNPINSYKHSVFIKMKFVPEIHKFACFCITPVGTCSSPCIKLYILCSCLYFRTIHISFVGLPYSALQYSFGTMIRFLVPFHVHIFCLAFFVCNHFEFLFQSCWNLYNIACCLNVIDKWIKPMLACTLHLIFYFYFPFKSCNFNYRNLLLLINNSFGIRHCNHQPCSRINGICQSSQFI